MPVVIFEGASGTGKTTAAIELSRRTGWPIYRAFRGDPNEHAPGSSQRDMSLIPIETNTWRPDLAVADFISQSRRANVIMDRTLISGIAHDPSMWDGPAPSTHGNDDWEQWSPSQLPNLHAHAHVTQLSDCGLATLCMWARMMSNVWTLLVQVVVPENIRVARGGRNGAWEATAIGRVIAKMPHNAMKRIMCFNETANEVVNDVMAEIAADPLGSMIG